MLTTFTVPERITGTSADYALGRAMVRAWHNDGIFQVATTAPDNAVVSRAAATSRGFFARPLHDKSSLVSPLTYSGYIASGEEETAGESDHSEIFTVCKGVPLDDHRVTREWPCHGPTPWPDNQYRDTMTSLMTVFGNLGERLLTLAALGLGLGDPEAFTRYTDDGWHHMRVLRFPKATPGADRGIGAHTDYGLLVIAYQDDVGGLFVRPPVEGEYRGRNWLPEESMAGMYQNDDPWTFVTPTPGVLTVFPGDIMQFLTGGTLLSTPHKVRLADRERYAVAYFHEPNFNATVRPIADPGSEDNIHYGTHFTNMFRRCYPNRVTTRAIDANGRMDVLQHLREGANVTGPTTFKI